jgi:hypothetical protein
VTDDCANACAVGIPVGFGHLFQSETDGICFAATGPAGFANWAALGSSALCRAKEEKSPLPLKHLT